MDLSGLEVETANESRRAFLLKDKMENGKKIGLFAMYHENGV